MIDLGKLTCGVPDCCLRAEFSGRHADLELLIDAIDKMPDKAENMKRRQALRHLVRTPKRELTDKQCIALGDAVFSMQCPKDATILTTNVIDHGPLANALNISVASP